MRQRDEPSSPTPVPPDRQATEHLANERTFLAWVRTAIAVLSLGFVVAKFGLWLDELAAVSGRGDGHAAATTHHHHAGASLPLGAGLMVLGASLALLGAWRFGRVSRAVAEGRVLPARRLVWVVAGVVAALAVLLIGYLALAGR